MLISASIGPRNRARQGWLSRSRYLWAWFRPSTRTQDCFTSPIKWKSCASGLRFEPITGTWESGERDRWRLKVQLLTRHGIEEEETFQPQPFSLIFTISDPEKKARVYEEMAQIVRNRFQSQNLTVRAAARVRAKQ